MTLTRRGRIVRNILLTALFLAAFWLLSNATTPDACKVPVDQMSQGCLDLLFP